MKADKIDNLANRIVSHYVSENANQGERMARIEAEISDVYERLGEKFKTFAHTQFVQNLSKYGNPVNELADKSKHQMEQIQQQEGRIRVAIDALQGRWNQQKEKLDFANREVARKLESDETFVDLGRKADECHRALSLAKDHFGDLVLEAAAKRPAFENDLAFSYLKRVGFGSRAYNAKSITARIDAILARKTRYEENRRNYELLLIIQNESDSQLRQVENGYSKSLASYEQYESDAYKTEEILSLAAALERIETTLHEEHAKLNRCVDELCEFAQAADTLSLEAKAIIESDLIKKDVQELALLASATEATDDDDALRSIKHLSIRVNELKYELAGAKTLFHQSSNSLARANEARSAIRKNSRLSGSRYRYPSESAVESVVTGYVLGSAAPGALVDALEKDCKYIPEPTPVNHSPSFGSSCSATSSSGGGSFSTSDSF